jgi:hypothetical protein
LAGVEASWIIIPVEEQAIAMVVLPGGVQAA